MVLLVPALTVGLYYQLGSPEMTRPAQERMAGAPHQGEAMPSVEEMMTALTARLKENPEDSEGWFLLGRSYMALDNYPMASQAFEKLHQLVGDDPVVLLSWADAQAMAQKGNLAGKPSELIRKAVKLAPEDTTALWLAGMVEDQSGNHQLAISYWERLEPKIKDDPESRKRIESLLASAREKAGSEKPTGPGPEPGAVSTAATATMGITVRVDLSPEFRGKVGPEESLFIYARALEGPRMPLAAARRKVSDLPLELTLDDSTAMMPAMKLSNFDQVLVGARVSRSGEAMARSGDLSGEVAPVRVGAAGTVEILIDKLVP
jgi:cytochrome c-type biogenesis protein CcmH